MEQMRVPTDQVRFSWRRLDRFQKWAMITTIATYFLIFVGGIVRASGAGLGCPDWPKCFGYWIPPASADMIAQHGFDASQFNPTLMWIEYINRLIGMLIGFFLLITTYLMLRHYRKSKRVFWSVLGALALTLFQGWLGGKVVHLELEGWIVTLHMILALVIVGLLLYATVCAFFPNGRPIANVPAERRTVARWGQALVGFGLVQLTLGALVRGHIDDVSSKMNIPRSDWVSQVGITDPLHRTGALIFTISILAATYAIVHNRSLHPWIHRTAWIASGLVLTQVAAGIGLAYGALPPPLQAIHLIVGSLLIGCLMTLVLLAYRLPVSPSTSNEAFKQVAEASH